VFNGDMGNYKVYRYEDKNGKNVIDSFIKKSSSNLKSKVLRLVDYLETYGTSPSNPALKKFVGLNMWELRSIGKDNIRILFAKYNDGFVSLHIFRKKTQKTDKKDVRIATKRLKELLD